MHGHRLIRTMAIVRIRCQVFLQSLIYVKEYSNNSTDIEKKLRCIKGMEDDLTRSSHT